MVQEAVQHLLSAIEAPDRLTDFAVRLRTLARADAAALRIVNTRTWRAAITATCRNAPLTSEFFAAYDKDYARADPHARVAMKKTLPRGYVYLCHEHYTREMRRADPYFEFISSHGIAWTAGYMAQLTDCEAVAFCAVRGPGKPPFGELERERLQPLAHLLRDWAMAFWFARKTAAAARAAQRALRMTVETVLCIDEEKRSLWEGSESDLSNLGLERFNGRLRATSPAEERLLVAAVAHAVANPTTPPATLRMRCGDVGVSGDGGDASPHAVVLSRLTAEPNANANFKDHVSKAERETVDLLAMGLTPSQIAQRRGVSISTVRTQIKRLYQKWGVHNLGQLLAKRRASS